MNDNNMVRFNPNKGETILKRDRQGKIVRDPITEKPINVPKLLMTCNPRELHNRMISDVVGATDGDKVLISKSKIRQILKSSCCHIKMMMNRQKMMCGCETCIIFDDIHRCVNLFRKRYISTLKKANDVMPNGQRRAKASNDKWVGCCIFVRMSKAIVTSHKCDVL